MSNSCMTKRIISDIQSLGEYNDFYLSSISKFSTFQRENPTNLLEIIEKIGSNFRRNNTHRSNHSRSIETKDLSSLKSNKNSVALKESSIND